MRPGRKPLRAISAIGICIVAALALTACGSSSNSSSTTSTDSGGSGGATTAAAKEAEQKVVEARKPLSAFPGPTEPAGPPPADKEIASIKVISSPFPNHIEESLDAAVEAVGWNIRNFTAHGTPHSFETAISSAMATQPDAIITNCLPIALLQPQLAEATSQGIEVVALSPGLPDGKSNEEWNILNQIHYEAGGLGETLADWVIQDAPEGAEAIALTSPEFVDLQTASKAFQQKLTSTPNYSVAEVVTSPVSDVGGGQTGVSRMATPMRKYGDAEFMFINSESWVPTFLQAAQVAQRSGEVTALGTDGDVSIPLIQEGQPIVMMGSAAKTYGWYAVDSLIRQWNDKEQPEYEVPLTLVDSENVDEYETEYIEATYDVAEEWEKLWK